MDHNEFNIKGLEQHTPLVTQKMDVGMNIIKNQHARLIGDFLDCIMKQRQLERRIREIEYHFQFLPPFIFEIDDGDNNTQTRR
tara:strand:- start:440 stop:688 length:249 start_codon:yes stop_codon:yes gene_type:complete